MGVLVYVGPLLSKVYSLIIFHKMYRRHRYRTPKTDLQISTTPLQ